jgi:hypothetical protein
MTRPSIVFIPCIWADGSSFSKVIPRFRRRADGGEQRMLEVASVAGVTLSAACVAAAAQIDEIGHTEWTVDCCLVGDWPTNIQRRGDL